MTKQSRTMSFVESCSNVAVGYGVAVAAQLIVLPLFGVHLSLSDNLIIGGIFTVISIARSFALRRLFEALRVRVASKSHPPRRDPRPLILRIHELDLERSELVNDVALATFPVNLAHGKSPSERGGSSG